MTVWNSYLFPTFDALIVGGGYTGLNTAFYLKQAKPKWKVAIVEKCAMGSAASTRNAGFACFGSPGEIIDDLKLRSEDEVTDLIRRRFLGIQNLGKFTGIDVQRLGGYEVFSKNNPETFGEISDAMPAVNEIFREATGIREMYKWKSLRKFNMNFHKEALFTKEEFQLNPGLLYQSLYTRCIEKGIYIHSNRSVKSWEKAGDVFLVGAGAAEYKTARLVICTNGTTSSIAPNEDIRPARAQVLLTKPLEKPPPQGNFHAERGYYYFRNWQNRLLLGGGRHIDLEGENTDETTTTSKMLDHLQEYLKEYILLDQEFEIETSWAGTMGFGKSKTPEVKKIEAGVFGAFAFGGMGVALSETTARELTKLILEA